MWVAPLPVNTRLQRKAYSQVTQATSAAVPRGAELQASSCLTDSRDCWQCSGLAWGGYAANENKLNGQKKMKEQKKIPQDLGDETRQLTHILVTALPRAFADRGQLQLYAVAIQQRPCAPSPLDVGSFGIWSSIASKLEQNHKHLPLHLNLPERCSGKCWLKDLCLWPRVARFFYEFMHAGNAESIGFVKRNTDT